MTGGVFIKREYSLYDLSQFIDHTNLKPNANLSSITKLCDEATKYGFKMAAINSVHTSFCSSQLKGTKVNVGAAISFPLGQNTLEAKLFETNDAITNGADEIDYVINITELKEKNFSFIQEEMASIVSLCKKNNIISKVIFENAYLEKEEIIKLAEIAKKVQPNFIKSSTGFAPSGAKIEDIKLMKKHVGSDVKVKAAGGIRDTDSFIDMIKCGADRIGTSSGVKIIDSFQNIINEQGVDYIEF